MLDTADNGIVYFSLGSNIKTASLAPSKLKILLKSFANLKQRVLFKWENGTIPEKPKNVIASKWFPQKSILGNLGIEHYQLVIGSISLTMLWILAHKNTKLFISHGGANSILEAKYYGVPMLIIPIYGEQMTNMEVAVHQKFAQVLHMYNFTEPIVTAVIKEMLENPR